MAASSNQGFDGDWVVQFHSVSNADVNGGMFEATSVDAINGFLGDTYSFASLEAEPGKLNARFAQGSRGLPRR